MARFPMPEDPARRKALRAIYDDMGLDPGMGVPNFWTGMALRPDLLEGAWALTRAMIRGELTPRQREFILAGVAAHNKAHYCCLTHSTNLRGLGVSEAEVASVVGDPELAALAEEDRRLVAFALKVSREPNALGEGDFRPLRQAGLRDELILEVVLLAAFSNWSNTWSSAADLILD